MMDAVKQIKSRGWGAEGQRRAVRTALVRDHRQPGGRQEHAILNSGLQFPFEDNRGNVVQGIGGTRNCDWYFTTNGIVLDTAGRYSVSVEDRLEWLTFLGLLKKNRPRAPINGVIIAASLAELSGSKPEFAIELAKNLRQRVQEITERLEVFAPVYVLFTKADLIAGFSEFFRNLDPGERESVGRHAAVRRTSGEDVLAAFDSHFDELAEGSRNEPDPHGDAAWPRGLAGPAVAAAGVRRHQAGAAHLHRHLFEDNPYQFKPVFRGFYFPARCRKGARCITPPSASAASSTWSAAPNVDEARPGIPAFFLKDLFRKVIFADKELVRSIPARTRTACAMACSWARWALALALGLWTYTTNAQLVANATRTWTRLCACRRTAWT
jgi:type VI secretion system protein ImpL